MLVTVTVSVLVTALGLVIMTMSVMRMRSLITAQALRNSLRLFGTVRAVNGIFWCKIAGIFP